MRCALVFYFVAPIFVIAYSVPEPCVFKDHYGERGAYCIKYINYTLDFIPPISQNISYITLQGQPLNQLPDNAFRNLSSQSNISEIWLVACQISHVDADALLNLHNLTVISLQFNDIKQIDSKFFRHTKQIKNINMGDNKIEVLPSGLFENLTVLEEVSLQCNRIHLVERFSFQNTPSLQMIELGCNQIEFMDVLFKDKFDNLTYLLLDNNPWKCDCELGPLYDIFIENNQLIKFLPKCEEPPTLHGRRWSNISRDEFVCRSEDAMSTQDSIITTTSTEPMTTTEQGTRYQQADTGSAKPKLLVLVLVGVTAVVTGVVFVVRYTLVKSNKRRHVQLPTIVKPGSSRPTNARQMDTSIPVRVAQSSAVSKDSVSVSNMDDVNEEQTSVHQYAIRETTTI